MIISERLVGVYNILRWKTVSSNVKCVNAYINDFTDLLISYALAEKKGLTILIKRHFKRN